MLVRFLNEHHGSVIIAALSGAMIFTLVQKKFHGKRKVLIFFVSFIMGILNADTATSIIQIYFPEHIFLEKEIGAFICSALIVTVAMMFISRIEFLIKKSEKE